MDTHIQFSNINFFYFALLKTSPEAKLLIIQKPCCLSSDNSGFEYISFQNQSKDCPDWQVMILLPLSGFVKRPSVLL